MSEKNVLNNFQMSEQYWGCLAKMSEVNFSPAETLKRETNLLVLNHKAYSLDIWYVA